MTLSKPARNLLLFKNRPVKRNVLNLAADNLLLFKTHHNLTTHKLLQFKTHPVPRNIPK